LQKALAGASAAKAVIIQHIFGYPADIKSIALWCRKNNLLLIEDLAQAYGARDRDGKPLGYYAKAVVLSFGRDKIIDAVSGGAAVIKSKSNWQKAAFSKQVSSCQQIKDLIYPFLTWIIRNTYSLAMGKLLHAASKKLKLISSPTASPTSQICSLPPAYAKLALKQLQEIDKQLRHRKKISKIYLKAAKNSFIGEKTINRAANLRFPLMLDKPDKLARFLQGKKIYVADRWYRRPVDFGSLRKETLYRKSSCPNTEKLCRKIFNLPTHINISASDAGRILKYLAQYQNET